MSEVGLGQGAALSIRITITDHCRLVFKDADGELVVESALSRDQLKSLCDALRPLLEQFQDNLVPSEQRTPREAGEALRRLHFGGRQILYALFDDDEKLNKASQMCRRACRNWEQPGWDRNSLAPRVIEVRTSVNYGLPIDLLPLLNPLKPRPVELMHDLARTAATFLGFSAIVKRTFADTLPAERRLRIENTDSFPLKMFWDGSLPQAKTAKKFFEDNRTHFDTKGGPWPKGSESSDADEFCGEFADYLGDPETTFDGQAGHGSDQLCYFFCHCDTSARNSNDYVLYLRDGGWYGRQRPVTLQCLADELRQRNLQNLQTGQKTGPRPLVFLNACGSASLDPAAATSFPDLFLKMGFLGFIGTEAKVPDAFGSMFAEVFYRHFVGGLTLGRALHAARWHMLRKGKSPLGILYTLFADPEIETRSKVGSLREGFFD